MIKLTWLYRHINLLSIDIVAGVVICASFFARIFQVQIRPQGLIVLGLTVWIIYTTDHLLDAYKTKDVASTERHRFHQHNFLALVILLVIGIIVNTILVFFIRVPVFQWGLLLIGIVLVYLLFQKHLLFFKEFIAAILYSSGIMLPSLVVATLHIDFFTSALIVQFFITAWFNLILFSWFDEDHDIQDKHNSFVTTVGRDRARLFLLFLFSVNVVIFIMQIILGTPWMFPLIILMAMNTILLFILLKKKWFAVDDRFRLLGDSIFLLPILFLV